MTVTITDGQRQKACAYALAQVGKPYKFGSTGPDSFDCSGLVLAAWQAAGIALPHNSEQQAEPWLNQYGRLVAYTPDNCKRVTYGDLAIYYSDWSHVGIFTNIEQPGGWWRITQATNEQQGVENIRTVRYSTPVGLVLMGHQ